MKLKFNDQIPPIMRINKIDIHITQLKPRLNIIELQIGEETNYSTYGILACRKRQGGRAGRHRNACSAMLSQ